MHRSFQHLDHLFHIVEIVSFWKTQIDGGDYERVPLRLARRSQAQAQKVVDSFFEGSSGSAGFLLQQPGYIFIEGKSSSHIMMLQYRHHDVNIIDIMMS